MNLQWFVIYVQKELIKTLNIYKIKIWRPISRKNNENNISKIGIIPIYLKKIFYILGKN